MCQSMFCQIVEAIDGSLVNLHMVLRSFIYIFYKVKIIFY